MHPKIRTLELYRPHNMQLAVHNCVARFTVVVWGRQSGKSTFAINHLLKAAWENPGKTYWFIAPVYSQALVQYRRLLAQLSTCLDVVRGPANQTEMRVTLTNGASIFFKSGEVFNNLRTETLDGVVIDELRDQRPELWPMVIRPMLMTTGGWCVFTTTANGFDEVYKLAEKAKLDTTGTWAFFTAPSTCNPLITLAEAETMKSEMTEMQYRQEVLAEFVNLRQGKVYSSAGPHNERLASPFTTDGGLVSPYLPITVGLDFNVNPMSWHLGQFRGRSSYWFGEIHVNDTNTPECAQELVTRLKALGEIRAKPQIKICGDATGESRNTKATETDYAIIGNALRTAGFTYSNDTPESNPPVRTRVLTVNGLLQSMDGTVQLFYNPLTCPKLKEDFDRVVWKQGAEAILDQVTDRSLTHASDSVGYPVCVYAPIQLSGGIGKLHVLPSRGF